MSADKLRLEAARWLRQARDDLDAARVLLSAGKLPQAGFLAQQAAEKAVKALGFRLDLDPWGHSIAQLLKLLPACEGDEDLVDSALALDKLYIPTRYPDALPDLIPAEAYSRSEIVAALADADRVVAAMAARLGALDSA